MQQGPSTRPVLSLLVVFQITFHGDVTAKSSTGSAGVGLAQQRLSLRTPLSRLRSWAARRPTCRPDLQARGGLLDTITQHAAPIVGLNPALDGQTRHHASGHPYCQFPFSFLKFLLERDCKP